MLSLVSTTTSPHQMCRQYHRPTTRSIGHQQLKFFIWMILTRNLGNMRATTSLQVGRVSKHNTERKLIDARTHARTHTHTHTHTSRDSESGELTTILSHPMSSWRTLASSIYFNLFYLLLSISRFKRNALKAVINILWWHKRCTFMVISLSQGIKPPMWRRYW